MVYYNNCVVVLLQVEQLNLLSDSNKLLREQKNKLEQQLEVSTSRVHELEGEVQPLKENMKMLTVQKDALVAEKTALKNEVCVYIPKISHCVFEIQRLIVTFYLTNQCAQHTHP